MSTKKKEPDTELIENMGEILNTIIKLKKDSFEKWEDIKEKFPVFDEKTSKEIFEILGEIKEETNAKEELKNKDFTEATIEEGLDKAVKSLPGPIAPIVNAAAKVATIPAAIGERVVGKDTFKLAKNSLNEGTKLATSTMYTIGADFAGPFGVLAASIPAMLMAGFTAALNASAGDIGKATTTFLSALPFIGSMINSGINALNKTGPDAIKSTELLKDKMPFSDIIFDRLPEQPEYIKLMFSNDLTPKQKELVKKLQKIVINAYVKQPDFKGGKRFSSRKNKKGKWKTLRKRLKNGSH
jgi:hypothetical protein